MFKKLLGAKGRPDKRKSSDSKLDLLTTTPPPAPTMPTPTSADSNDPPASPDSLDSDGVARSKLFGKYRLANNALKTYMIFKQPDKKRRDFLIPKDKAAWLEFLVQMVKKKTNVEYLSDKELRKVIIRARPNLAGKKPTFKPDPDAPICTNWTEEQTAQWIHDAGFPYLKDAFVENHINGRRLVTLDCSALNKIGMQDLTEMKKVTSKIRTLLKIPPPNMLRALMRIPPFEKYLKHKIMSGITYDTLTFEKFCKEEGFNYMLLRTNKNALIPCTCEVRIVPLDVQDDDEEEAVESEEDDLSLLNAPTVECIVRNLVQRDQTVALIIEGIMESVFSDPESRKYGKPILSSFKDALNRAENDLGGMTPEERLEFATAVANALLEELQHTTQVLNDINALKMYIKDDISQGHINFLRGCAEEFMENVLPIAGLMALGELDLETIFKDQPEFREYVDDIAEDAEMATNSLVPDALEFVESAINLARKKVKAMSLPGLSVAMISSAKSLILHVLEEVLEDAITLGMEHDAIISALEAEAQEENNGVQVDLPGREEQNGVAGPAAPGERQGQTHATKIPGAELQQARTGIETKAQGKPEVEIGKGQGAKRVSAQPGANLTTGGEEPEIKGKRKGGQSQDKGSVHFQPPVSKDPTAKGKNRKKSPLTVEDLTQSPHLDEGQNTKTINTVEVNLATIAKNAQAPQRTQMTLDKGRTPVSLAPTQAPQIGAQGTSRPGSGSQTKLRQTGPSPRPKSGGSQTQLQATPNNQGNLSKHTDHGDQPLPSQFQTPRLGHEGAIKGKRPQEPSKSQENENLQVQSQTPRQEQVSTLKGKVPQDSPRSQEHENLQEEQHSTQLQRNPQPQPGQPLIEANKTQAQRNLNQAKPGIQAQNNKQQGQQQGSPASMLEQNSSGSDKKLTEDQKLQISQGKSPIPLGANKSQAQRKLRQAKSPGTVKKQWDPSQPEPQSEHIPSDETIVAEELEQNSQQPSTEAGQAAKPRPRKRRPKPNTAVGETDNTQDANLEQDHPSSNVGTVGPENDLLAQGQEAQSQLPLIQADKTRLKRKQEVEKWAQESEKDINMADLGKDPNVLSEEQYRLVRITADQIVQEAIKLALTHMLFEASAGKNTKSIMTALKNIQRTDDDDDDDEDETQDVILWKPDLQKERVVKLKTLIKTLGIGKKVTTASASTTTTVPVPQKTQLIPKPINPIQKPAAVTTDQVKGEMKRVAQTSIAAAVQKQGNRTIQRPNPHKVKSRT